MRTNQMRPATVRRLNAIVDRVTAAESLEVTSGHDVEWTRDWWEIKDVRTGGGILHIYIDQDPNGWGCTICDAGESRTASLRQVEIEIATWETK